MRLPRRHRHARLELLPLMDVVFLILVFLVYAMLSMVAHMGMPVTLPASKSAQPEQIVTLALAIQEDGSLWLDKDPVRIANLPEEIRARMKAQGSGIDSEPVIQVFADAALSYQKLFNVLDVLKNAGLKKISLQAREGS